MKTRRVKLTLVKLDDEYVFGGDKSKHHWYAMFKKDPNNDEVYLRQINHLYQYDPKRKADLDKGFYEEFKSKTFWRPSGLNITYRNLDSKNKQFTQSEVDKNAQYKTTEVVLFRN